MTADASLLPRYIAAWKNFVPQHAEMIPAGMVLFDAYADAARPYHNLTHLKDVLAKLDWARDACRGEPEMQALLPGQQARMFAHIELALFYHDVIYDAKAKDNEAKSRDLFLADAARFGMGEDDKRAIARLIDITAKHTAAESLDEKIMSDCDLAILGADAETFAAYDRNIRREYAHLPAPAYALGRAQVLARFRDADPLFKTAAFQKQYGVAAKHNLTLATQQPSPVKKILRLFGR